MVPFFRPPSVRRYNNLSEPSKNKRNPGDERQLQKRPTPHDYSRYLFAQTHRRPFAPTTTDSYSMLEDLRTLHPGHLFPCAVFLQQARSSYPSHEDLLHHRLPYVDAGLRFPLHPAFSLAFLLVVGGLSSGPLPRLDRPVLVLRVRPAERASSERKRTKQTRNQQRPSEYQNQKVFVYPPQ